MKCQWEGCDREAEIVVCRKHYGELTQKRMHGVAEYRRGCRCPVCTRAQSLYCKEYYAKNQEQLRAQQRAYRARKKKEKQ